MISPITNNSIVGKEPFAVQPPNLEPKQQLLEKVVEHEILLERMLEQVEEVDFYLLEYPKIAHLRKNLVQAKTKLAEFTQTEQTAKEEGKQTVSDLKSSTQEVKEYKTTIGEEKEQTVTKEGDVEKIEQEIKDIVKKIDSCKITLVHYRVHIVEELVRLMEKLNWQVCTHHEAMYLFNGAYWKIIDEAQIKKFLGRVAWQMGVRVTDARDISFKDKLYSLFVYNTLLDPPKTDDTSVLINLQNGTLEVSSNIMQEPTLREYRAEDFLRYQLPFEYNPMAKAPTFLKYLYEVLPEEDKRNVLAEYMGYVFIRHSSKSMKLEKCLMLFGSGANGKSVFFEVMNALFGRENTTNKTLEDLTTGSNFKNSLAEIDGKLLNYDSDFGKNIKADTFKKMVSGEPLEARRLYKQPYEMNDYAKLIFNTNNLPSVSEHTRAYFRRFLIIPFEVEIPEERQDNELHKKIIDKELSGVLNWVLDGLERLMKQRKFTPCPSADAMLKQYQKESDSAMMFMEEEQYQKSEGTTTLLKVLYSQYRDFCLDAGLKPLSNRNFAQRLKNAGYQSDKGREGKYFYVFRQKSAF